MSNEPTVPALTICQPYAHLIVTGSKKIENRTWGTAYRGTLAIHAGKSTKWFDDVPADVKAMLPSMVPGRYAMGVLVGVVEVVGCMSLEELREARGDTEQFKRFAWGPVCWLLSGEKQFVRPVPYRGQPGIFRVPDRLIRRPVCSD